MPSGYVRACCHCGWQNTVYNYPPDKRKCLNCPHMACDQCTVMGEFAAAQAADPTHAVRFEHASSSTPEDTKVSKNIVYREAHC